MEVGVCSAGLRTTQLPAANAGATYNRRVKEKVKKKVKEKK
jgi:hypothetical protein